MSWSKATKHTSFPSNATLTEKQNRDLILQFQNDQPKPEDYNYDAKQFAYACSEYWKNMANFVTSMKLQSNDSKPISLNIDHSTQAQNNNDNNNKAKNLIGFRDDPISPRNSSSNMNNNNQKNVNILHSSTPTLSQTNNNNNVNNNNISPINLPNKPVSSAPILNQTNNGNNINISPRSHHNRPASNEGKFSENNNNANHNNNNTNNNNSNSVGPSLTSGNRMAFRKSSAQKDGIPSQMTGGRTHSKCISLGVNKVSLDDFKLLKLIGRGTSGKVYLATNKSTGDKLYALKMLKKASVGQRGEVEHTKAEQLVMARLRSPFIAKLNFSFQNETHLFLAMDFVNGGELYFHLNQSQFFEEDRAKFYTAEIILALELLHSHGIIYRDLKPENILLSNSGHIVMVDFGLAKHGLAGLDDRTTTFCGTPTYIAPEVLRGEKYSKAIDYWSLGIMVFEMISGSPPFYSENDANVYAAIMNAPLEIPDYFSIEVADFVSSLLERQEKDRLREAAIAKKHAWFRDIDWIAMSKLEVTPPFIPAVKDDKDLGMINEDLLNEEVNEKCLDDQDPFGEFNSSTPSKEDIDFGSFTYNGSG